MDTRIYIMTHKEFDVPQVEGYLPLQVGCAGKEKLGYLRDDIGDHISEKNASYCELTGLYWAWKNVECDIIGLSHYRRYLIKGETESSSLSLEEKLLDKDYIEACLEKYDLIVPNSGMSAGANVLSQYVEHHRAADWVECGKVIAERHPEYYPAFTWNQRCNFISLGNMFIGRKALMDEYCEWLFDILFELEKRIDISDSDTYQKRVFGFLAERLFRVWMLEKPLRVREEQMVFIGS